MDPWSTVRIRRSDEMQDVTGSPSFLWPVKDIVYTSVIGSVFLLALVEFFVSLLAFNYSYFQILRKTKIWSTRFLSVLNIILFTILRFVFLAVMVFTLPFNHFVSAYFPKKVVTPLLWFALANFTLVVGGQFMICTYQAVMKRAGRRRLIKDGLLEESASLVSVVMPCHKEPPERLLKAVDSVVDSEYPRSRLHLFVSFDGDEKSKPEKNQTENYLRLLQQLGTTLSFEQLMAQKSVTLTYRDVKVTVSRFRWGGKRHVQDKTFQLLEKTSGTFEKESGDTFILFIDSDCILDGNCIQNFIWEMELKPGAKKRNILAMTGVITSTERMRNIFTPRDDNSIISMLRKLLKVNPIISLIQDVEYVHGQLCERNVESACGAVTCLPGALTIFRTSAFSKLSKEYFADKLLQVIDLFDYCKAEMGEDRWLTHIFMVGAEKPYQIGMSSSAFCKTRACETTRELLSQRRRWFLGFISNEACMLTDINLWRKYPVVLIGRFLQNTCRTTSLMWLITFLSLVVSERKFKNTPMMYMMITFGFNWAYMIYLGWSIDRKKAWLYPIMFLLNPFFNCMYMVYAVCTVTRRGWGGPRGDEEEANEDQNPREAVEKARRELKDDLAVNPETFRNHSLKEEHIPVQPGNELRGRFNSKRESSSPGLFQGSSSSLDNLPWNSESNTPRRKFSFESDNGGGDAGDGDLGSGVRHVACYGMIDYNLLMPRGSFNEDGITPSSRLNSNYRMFLKSYEEDEITPAPPLNSNRRTYTNGYNENHITPAPPLNSNYRTYINGYDEDEITPARPLNSKYHQVEMGNSEEYEYIHGRREIMIPAPPVPPPKRHSAPPKQKWVLQNINAPPGQRGKLMGIDDDVDDIAEGSVAAFGANNRTEKPQSTERPQSGILKPAPEPTTKAAKTAAKALKKLKKKNGKKVHFEPGSPGQNKEEDDDSYKFKKRHLLRFKLGTDTIHDPVKAGQRLVKKVKAKAVKMQEPDGATYFES